MIDVRLTKTYTSNQNTARKGILFAAFLKLLVPVIAVLPGITMYVLHHKGLFQQEIASTPGDTKPTYSCMNW